ncbi:unnamed protein product [Amoebophrya sp. A120]|nr:unnamed protein product [Amoebophrya sp. A120]|eukprot:GSA120T00001496001.1
MFVISVSLSSFQVPRVLLRQPACSTKVSNIIITPRPAISLHIDTPLLKLTHVPYHLTTAYNMLDSPNFQSPQKT